MTDTHERSPSALDLWLIRHSTLVLLIGLVMGIAGVVVGTTARTHGGDGLWKWVFYVPGLLVVGFAARGKSMSKRSQT